ncbi:MAG TPA: hypothetical protein VMV00_01430 [Candidatus Baltobacteraceae bacterium]|nr:hypothetical protein [Candidatus Baltobacteraceae bacterium]
MDNRTKRFAALFAVALIALTGIVGVLPSTTAAQTAQQTAVQPGCALLPPSIAQEISSSEPWYCPINQQIFAQWKGSLPLAFAAVIVSFMIAAAIIMAGIALKSDKIRNFGTGELYEAIATAMIVAGFLYVCAVLFGLIPAVLVGGANPYAASFHLISGTLATSQQLYTSIYNIYYYFDYVLSVNFGITSSVPILGQQKFGLGESSAEGRLGTVATAAYTIPITVFILDPARTIGIFLVDSTLALSAEYYALQMFASAAIPAFIVPGIVLRSIFPTRALGGFLIALGIAFYLVAPTLFALAFYFTAPTLQSAMQNSINQLSQYSSGASIQPQSISASSPLATTLSSIPTSMSAFWLLALFFPALIIAITYAFTTQLSRFLGGASRTGSRLRGFI